MPGEQLASTPEDFFAGHPEGLAVYRAVAEAVATLGPCEVRVTKSQIAFRRLRGFAYLWRPGQYLASDVPAVLSIPLRRQLESTRWKEVAHPSPKVWMHHLEVRGAAEIDDEVLGWLREARTSAG